MILIPDNRNNRMLLRRMILKQIHTIRVSKNSVRDEYKLKKLIKWYNDLNSNIHTNKHIHF